MNALRLRQALDVVPPAAPRSDTGAPQFVSWNLTRLCNLKCGHCYLDAVQRAREAPDELTTDDAVAVLAQLAELAPGAMLILTGGEPLLRRDLATLVGTAARAGLMPVIGTNGMLLSPERARGLKAAGAAGVGISLDAPDPAFHDRLRGVNGAWQRAVEGIASAHAAGLQVLMQTTLFEENRRDLEALADLAERLGAVALNLFFLVCTGRGVTQTDLAPGVYEETLRAIAALRRRRTGVRIRARCAPYMRRIEGLHAGEARDGYAEWSSACLAGRKYFRITPQGRVTPCPYLPEAVGDLKREPLAAIWAKSPTMLRLRAGSPGGKCGHCDYRVSCGGCRARAFAANGDIMAEDPKCEYVPSPSAPREAAAESPVTPEKVTWSPEAAARLECIPAFLRSMVRKRLEAHACREGVGKITAEFVRAHRPDHLSSGPTGANP